MRAFSSKRLPFILIPLCTIVLLILFRSAPAGAVWKNYRVLAVDLSVPDEQVRAILAEANCTDVISLSEQYIPLRNDVPPLTHSFAMSADAGNYLARRTLYFFDKTGEYRLYYVPRSAERNVQTAVALFEAKGIAVSVDMAGGFPWIAPIITALCVLIAGYFSHRKKIFVSGMLFPLLFSVSMPYYAAAAAVCLALPFLFVAAELLPHEKFFPTAVRNPLAILAVFGAALSGTVSLPCLGLFVLTAASTATAYIGWFRRLRRRQRGFARVAILPAHLALANVTFVKFVFYNCGGALAVLFLISVSGIRFLPAGNSLELPSRNVRFSHELPGLDDYVRWHWQADTAPYRSAYVPYRTMRPHEGERITVTRYADNGARIIPQESVLFTYDEAYRAECIGGIERLPFQAIERLLKREQVRGDIGYSSGGGENNPLRTALLLPISGLLLGIFFFVYRLFEARLSLFTGKTHPQFFKRAV